MLKDLCLLFILLLSTLLVFGANASEQFRTNLHHKIRKGHQPSLSYSRAKSYLFGQLHLKSGPSGYIVEDVYCHVCYGKKYGVGKMKEPNASFINTEHTWPQSKFTHHDRRFQKTDLHHLFPTMNKANSSRSNHIFAEVDGYELAYCGGSYVGNAYGTSITAFEPPDDHKGNVARALFYFAIRYKGKISDLEEYYLKRWHLQDPPDEKEVRRNAEIEVIQGNRNPFIDDPSLASRIENF